MSKEIADQWREKIRAIDCCGMGGFVGIARTVALTAMLNFAIPEEVGFGNLTGVEARGLKDEIVDALTRRSSD